ncbi:MAG: TonB-dependent receptor [Sphingomonadaceae bacterium]
MAFASKAYSRIILATGASAIALGSAVPAMAQEAEDTSAGREIVVTAQFREQKLQDTPLSITAIDSELLDARNQSDISQIAAQAPNVNLTEMGGAFGSSMAVYIRGIGQYDFNPAYEPGVGMYVDDVYYATLTGSIMDLLDLERVEVLRGPQGTLTGRNSIGGAIKLFSKKPSDETSGMVEVAYGSRNRIDIRANANFALTDNLFARVAAVHKEQDGYVDQIDYGCANPGNALGIGARPSTPDNCVVDKLGERDYTGVRGALRFNPSDTIDWTVIGDYTYENRTNAGGVIFASRPAAAGADFTCGKYCTYADWHMDAGGQALSAYDMPNNTKFKGWGLSSNLTIGLSDTINIQSITAYRKYNQVFGTDDDYTPNQLIGGGGFNDISFRFFSQELRVNGEIGDFADWTIGGYYNDQKSVYFTRQDIRYIVPIGNPALYLQFQGDDPVNADSKAVFGTVIVHPAPDMNVTLGARYTDEHKDYTFFRKQFDGSPLVDIFGVGLLDNGGAGTRADYDGDRFDWRISVDYRFSPSVLGYATISTGFKGGGVTARPFTTAQAVNGTFDPETLTAYEIGFKTDLLDRRLRFNISGFYNDYKDIQLPIADCALLDGFPIGQDPFPCAAVQNTGDGKMYGIEAEMFATPTEGLQIDAALSWIDGKWKSLGATVGNTIQLDDDITNPKWKASFGIQYEADLGGNGSLTPRFDLAYQSKVGIGRTTSATGDVRYLPSRTLGNARLTWRNEDRDLALSFEVQNLFDKYYLGQIPFQALYGFVGTAYANAGRPREWALTLRKDF